MVTASGSTVAIRAPRHPIAQALIHHAQTQIAAPSANRFSHTSPTTAQHVWDNLNGRIEMILDGGATAIGVESTVLDVTGAVPVLLRPRRGAARSIDRCHRRGATANTQQTGRSDGIPRLARQTLCTDSGLVSSSPARRSKYGARFYTRCMNNSGRDVGWGCC